MAARRPKKWIAKAIRHPGALRKKAKRAKMSTHAFAEKEKGAPGRTGKEARLALTLGRMHKGRKATRKRARRA